MAVESPYYSTIAGTGHYLPEGLITNKYIESKCDTTEEWIRERTGINVRHKAADGEYTSDLSLQASLRALEAANMKPEDIEAILVCTVSGDQVMPNTACVLQHKLGLKGIFALDISAACSGFVYGLAVADQFIRTGPYKNMLVVGAEVLSRYINFDDRNTCILFGDGAGAAVVRRAEPGEGRIHSHHLHAEGSIGDVFVLPAGGSKLPLSQEVLDKGLHWVQMKGKEIFKHAVRTMSESCKEALEYNNMSADEVNWIIPHQANRRIIEAVAKHFGAPLEKVVIEIEDMGNTSAATVPVAFDRAVRDGRIQRGHNVMLTAFGAGVTSGSLLLTY